jgi:hypothetical protein
MANLVITSTTNTINVSFNDLSVPVGIKKGCWNKTRITFNLAPSDLIVKVLVIGESSWAISFDGSSGTLPVDSVNGVAPTSNSDLYDKLVALIT